MLYCPHCRRTYSLGDLVCYMEPRTCIRCGHKRIIRWDGTRRARRETWGPLESIFVPGGRL